ncbi:hypothetical protein QBC45DRAFT_82920 [Copromyces sp. CBS 386.78]|nr:hypothetical protein QBC45DRAFT_82920 [Copromyces sp. CBS 386.78]
MSSQWGFLSCSLLFLFVIFRMERVIFLSTGGVPGLNAMSFYGFYFSGWILWWTAFRRDGWRFVGPTMNKEDSETESFDMPEKKIKERHHYSRFGLTTRDRRYTSRSGQVPVGDVRKRGRNCSTRRGQAQLPASSSRGRYDGGLRQM